MSDDQNGGKLPTAYEIARTALDKTHGALAQMLRLETRQDAADKTLAEIASKLAFHIEWYTREAVQNRNDLKEWREILGERLDKLDEQSIYNGRMIVRYGVMIGGGIITMLLAALGWAIEHIVSHVGG